jgi:hypothetical protein
VSATQLAEIVIRRSLRFVDDDLEPGRLEQPEVLRVTQPVLRL